MKKKILVTLVTAFAILNSWCQDATVKDLQKAANKEIKASDTLLNGWTHSGTFNLNINQGSLQNWAAGGEQNTLGISSILNYGINYRHDKNTWDNYFDLALGFQNATSFNRFRKIDDRIDITSKYGHQVSSIGM